MELLEFISSTTYFSFRGQIFRQKFCTAMGSLVSLLMANKFMEHLQEKLHVTVPMELKLKLWKRFVDDILEVVRKCNVIMTNLKRHMQHKLLQGLCTKTKGSMEELTEFVNKLDESGSVKFAYEVEQDGNLPF